MAEQTTQEAIAEIWQLFKETSKQFKETDARLDQRFAESDARFEQRLAKTDAEIAKTNANLQKLEGLFGNHWGRLVEALVQLGVLSIFQDRGHDVRRLYQRSTAHVNGKTMEMDIILEDDTDVIPVEVKTKMTIEHVDFFLADLAEFTAYFPKYKGYNIYGAVAALEFPRDVARYTYKRGLYVVNVSGSDMVTIANDDKFTPKDFGETLS